MDRKKSASDDHALFREAMSDVTPIRNDDRVEPAQERRKPEPLQRRLDDERVMQELLELPADLPEIGTGEELGWLRPGHSPRILRRLRRGRYSIQDSIDLHHMDAATARTVLIDFVERALSRGLGCVKVIHGKGLRSRSGPVLKTLCNRILRSHAAVIAFSSCPPGDGGTGATRVLLRARNPR